MSVARKLQLALCLGIDEMIHADVLYSLFILLVIPIIKFFLVLVVAASAVILQAHLQRPKRQRSRRIFVAVKRASYQVPVREVFLNGINSGANHRQQIPFSLTYHPELVSPRKEVEHVIALHLSSY